MSSMVIIQTKKQEKYYSKVSRTLTISSILTQVSVIALLTQKSGELRKS